MNQGHDYMGIILEVRDNIIIVAKGNNLPINGLKRVKMN